MDAGAALLRRAAAPASPAPSIGSTAHSTMATALGLAAKTPIAAADTWEPSDRKDKPHAAPAAALATAPSGTGLPSSDPAPKSCFPRRLNGAGHTACACAVAASRSSLLRCMGAPLSTQAVLSSQPPRTRTRSLVRTSQPAAATAPAALSKPGAEGRRSDHGASSTGLVAAAGEARARSPRTPSRGLRIRRSERCSAFAASVSSAAPPSAAASATRTGRSVPPRLGLRAGREAAGRLEAFRLVAPRQPARRLLLEDCVTAVATRHASETSATGTALEGSPGRTQTSALGAPWAEGCTDRTAAALMVAVHRVSLPLPGRTSSLRQDTPPPAKEQGIQATRGRGRPAARRTTAIGSSSHRAGL
mmetsp:Transcript_3495/g.14444  ORF Transcript_3495/g.14444 Transcript_3495/m.14444 type:complete len:361 (+) Transcript_3495:2909-3991(+)